MAYKFQTKIGTGYLAIEADDLDNFLADLAQVYGQEKADKILTAAAESDPTAAPEPEPRPSAARPPAAAPPSVPQPPRQSSGGSLPAGLPADWDTNPPLCGHGQPRRARKWERNGRTNYTWYCDLPQERRAEQCTPIDAATGKEWGSR